MFKNQDPGARVLPGYPSSNSSCVTLGMLLTLSVPQSPQRVKLVIILKWGPNLYVLVSHHEY